MLDNVRRAAGRLGLHVIEMERLWRASEDFGWYTRDTEGAIFYIGTGEDHAPLHTDGFRTGPGLLPAIGFTAEKAGPGPGSFICRKHQSGDLLRARYGQTAVHWSCSL